MFVDPDSTVGQFFFVKVLLFINLVFFFQAS